MSSLLPSTFASIALLLLTGCSASVGTSPGTDDALSDADNDGTSAMSKAKKAKTAGASPESRDGGTTATPALPSGTVDTSYGTDGVLSLESADEDKNFSRLVFREDGSALAIGSTKSAHVIRRVDANGHHGSEPDILITPPQIVGAVGITLESLHQLDDGRTLVHGRTYGQIYQDYLMFLLPSGQQDLTFGSKGFLQVKTSTKVVGLYRKPSGTVDGIYVTYENDLPGSSRRLVNNRWTLKGVADPSYSWSSTQDWKQHLVDAAGGIICSDLETSFASGGSTHVRSMQRLAPDGTLDKNYGSNGTVALGVIPTPTAPSPLLLRSGDVFWTFVNYNPQASPPVSVTFRRIDKSGKVLDVFPNAKTRTASEGTIVRDEFADGRLLVETSEGLVRWNKDGSDDPTFNVWPRPRTEEGVFRILQTAIGASGKVMIVGDTLNGKGGIVPNSFRVIRLN